MTSALNESKKHLGLISNVVILFPGSISKEAGLKPSKPTYLSIKVEVIGITKSPILHSLLAQQTKTRCGLSQEYSKNLFPLQRMSYSLKNETTRAIYVAVQLIVTTIPLQILMLPLSPPPPSPPPCPPLPPSPPPPLQKPPSSPSASRSPPSLLHHHIDLPRFPC